MSVRAVLLVLFSLQSSTALSQKSPMSVEYLAGTWSLGGKQGCDSGSADYAIFRANGTAELGRGTTARITGFWELSRDAIILHMLVSPRGATELHPFYQDSYHYQYRAAQVLDTREDALDISVGAQAQGDRYTLTRCR